MAKGKKNQEKENTVMAREILSSAEKPAHLASTGRGRTRQATEFDDLVLDWYKEGAWKGVPVQDGETIQDVFNAVKRAADYHNLGIDRQKDEGNNAVWVFVRDPQHRGPKVGSRKDPRTGKMVQPDDDGYDDLVAWLETDEGKQAAAEARQSRQKVSA